MNLEDTNEDTLSQHPETRHRHWRNAPRQFFRRRKSTRSPSQWASNVMLLSLPSDTKRGPGHWITGSLLVLALQSQTRDMCSCVLRGDSGRQHVWWQEKKNKCPNGSSVSDLLSAYPTNQNKNIAADIHSSTQGVGVKRARLESTAQRTGTGQHRDIVNRRSHQGTDYVLYRHVGTGFRWQLF